MEQGLGYLWLAFTVWGPNRGSCEEAPLRRSFWHALTAEVWDPLCGTLLLTAQALSSGGSTQVMASKWLPAQVQGWYLRSVWMLAWLYF